jgi:hypothetical protein
MIFCLRNIWVILGNVIIIILQKLILINFFIDISTGYDVIKWILAAKNKSELFYNSSNDVISSVIMIMKSWSGLSFYYNDASSTFLL